MLRGFKKALAHQEKQSFTWSESWSWCWDIRRSMLNIQVQNVRWRKSLFFSHTVGGRNPHHLACLKTFNEMSRGKASTGAGFCSHPQMSTVSMRSSAILDPFLGGRLLPRFFIHPFPGKTYRGVAPLQGALEGRRRRATELLGAFSHWNHYGAIGFLWVLSSKRSILHVFILV